MRGLPGGDPRSAAQQLSIAHTHRVQETEPCRGREGGGPQGWGAGGSAGRRARSKRGRGGLSRTAASRGRIPLGCAPRPRSAGAGGAARGRGVSRAFPGRRAVEPGPQGPRPARGRRAASGGQEPGSGAPPQSVPYLGEETRSRGAGSWARAGPPPARRSALPAARQPGLMRLPERRRRAANGELETPEARPPGPAAGSALASAGVSLQPGSPDVRSAATRGPRGHPPPCSDLSELPPAPELFPR